MLQLLPIGPRPRVRAASRAHSWAALCLLYIVGWLAHGLHMSQASHAICEHGAVEHGAVENIDPSHIDERSSDDGVSLPHAELAGAHWLPNDEGADAPHHHCAMATPSAVVEFEWVALVAACLPPTVDVPRIARTAPRASRVPVFALAPHHSPPIG